MLERDARFAGFEDVVGSERDLDDVIGTPPPKVVAKVLDHLDPVCRAFIACSPFCVLASANPDGHLDVSPKGDPPGFVHVLDDKRLAIPDRPGNRRVDTFHNLLRDPRLAMIFFVPGRGETLRVSGEARIVKDRALCEAMAVDGKVPAVALVLYVERAFVHCPKCMVRSRLWHPEAWPDSTRLPSIGEAMIAHAKLATTPDELRAEAEREGLTRLY